MVISSLFIFGELKILDRCQANRLSGCLAKPGPVLIGYYFEGYIFCG